MPSINAIKAVTAQETEEVFLTLLSLFIDNEKILTICDDNQPVISNNETFTPWGFKAILPDQSAESSSSCRLQIDNVDLNISRLIKKNINHRISVEVKVVMASTPDSIEQGPFFFVLRNIRISAKTISGELFDDYLADKKYSSMTYNPTDFPGMFF